MSIDSYTPATEETDTQIIASWPASREWGDPPKKISSFSLSTECDANGVVTFTFVENAEGNVPTNIASTFTIDIAELTEAGKTYATYLGLASLANQKAGLARSYRVNRSGTVTSPLTGRQFSMTLEDVYKKFKMVQTLEEFLPTRKSEWTPSEDFLKALEQVFEEWDSFDDEKRAKLGYKRGMTPVQWLRSTGRYSFEECCKIAAGERMRYYLQSQTEVDSYF